MNINRHSRTSPRQSRGFTLIEALVALIVVAFGMLAMAGMQLTLSRNADLARQRGEATRLAEEMIEQLRAFNSIATGTGLIAWDSLASGTDQPTTTSNASFSRAWTVGGTNADSMRSVRVTVSWTDRAGDTPSVTLDSYIAKIDPALSGALGFPLPGNGTIKRPKNRNLNIPIQAHNIDGTGTSVVPLSSTFAIVFSNDSGYVVKRCSQDVTTQAQITQYCTDYPAYILAGYVSGSMSTPPATGISLSGLSGSSSHGAVDCSFGNATDQNSGTAISGYKYYLCVIQVASSGAAWSGTVRLTGMATGTDYTVCRFQYATAGSLNANERNVQPYASVTESLDQQNYYVTTSSSCPTVGGLALTSHQVCRSSGTSANANRATDCPASPDTAP
jgi:type IV pilus modification protein PilV